MIRGHFVVVVVVALLASASCSRSKASNQAELTGASSDAAKIAALTQYAETGKAETKDTQAVDVVANPSKYIQTSDVKTHDKGLIHHFTELVGVTVVNKAQVPVNELAGTVEWTDAHGKLIGSVPFTLKGSVLPGDTKEFTAAAATLASGNIEGKAALAKFHFSHVNVPVK